MNTEQRLVEIENAIGHILPGSYRAFVLRHREDPDRHPCIVTSNPDYWGVRTIFELAEGPASVQLDVIHRLVHDVIPHGMIAVGEDSSGNLYLLGYEDGPAIGTIYWWNHERDVGDCSVETVADSFDEFMSSLAPDTDD